MREENESLKPEEAGGRVESGQVDVGGHHASKMVSARREGKRRANFRGCIGSVAACMSGVELQVRSRGPRVSEPGSWPSHCAL